MEKYHNNLCSTQRKIEKRDHDFYGKMDIFPWNQINAKIKSILLIKPTSQPCYFFAQLIRDLPTTANLKKLTNFWQEMSCTDPLVH